MPPLAPPSDPPPIPGVRRSLHEARGVQFHVTEAGPEDAAPVLALHGWPQHHYCYRDLLADPPAGMRLIAPDLPGYGWSGPPPHRWAKEDVASDLLALLDELGLKRVLLVGHDWGGWIGQLMVLREPERFSGFLALGIPHVWNSARTTLPQLWRLGHMPLNAACGTWLCMRTPYIERLVFRLGVGNHAAFTTEDIRWFADRFRDPVCARATTDTYRTFVLRELPAGARQPERRRATVPIRALLGTKDFAIHRSLMAPETALADDYTLELVPGAGHFLAEEAPGIVRERLLELA
ncbi:MAG TPA: alpha/beta hydrolase [Solirubrobacteraceae bacterium]|nr:alpha/beta hydrolase [Solirubrobacteraceae bacterium]